MEQTYQQLLAEVYDENAKNVLVHQTEYDDETQPGYEEFDYSDNELDDKEAFNKFHGDRGKPEHVIKPQKAASGDALASVKKDSIFRMNVLSIDGGFREKIAPVINLGTNCAGNSTQYVELSKANVQLGNSFLFRTSRQYKNVYSVEVTSLEFSNSFYTFSSARQNTTFSIIYPYTNTPQDGVNTYVVEIPDGNYINLVNKTTNTPYLPNILPNPIPVGYILPSDTPDKTTLLGAIQFAINNIPGLLVTDGNGGSSPRITINYASISHLVYFQDETTGSVNFSLVFPDSTANPYTNGIGYNLGILEHQVFGNLQLPPDEVQNIYTPNGFVTFKIVADTFPDIVQDNYVFLKLSDWDLITHVNANQTRITAFMKVLLTAPKFTLQFDNKSNNSTHKQFHFQQPTNINSILVSITDAYGNILDLKYGTFSLTLQIQECLSNETYEALLENK